MKRVLFCLFFLYAQLLRAQSVSKECMLASPLDTVSEYCSADHQFNNNNPTKIKWLKFTAKAFDVNINVSGKGSGGTLVSPDVKLYSDCSGTELVGSVISENNVTSLYKGALVIGNTYYIGVSGAGKASGTFKICLNNFDPVLKAGQDCATASFLCSTQTISQNNVTGAGLNNNEGKGTCLDAGGQATESNSVWYKWQAANNGTLVFTITPNSIHDDIDWVLFDLGTSGDCSNVNPANAIRCKAGYGVDNVDCPTDTVYYKTGLDFSEKDLSEPAGCGKGQNGKVKFVASQQGHYYGLLINNFSSGNNGFTLSFTDQKGKAGTVVFAGPQPSFTYTAVSGCSENTQYVFTSQTTNYDSLKWSFGDGATLVNAPGNGPQTVTYASGGIKTITLQATGQGGCTVTASQQIKVSVKPPLPVLKADKTSYCVNDTVTIRATTAPNITYSWTGPNNFRSDSAVAVISVKGEEMAGNYRLVTHSFQCSSDTATIMLSAPLVTPVADFHTDPAGVNALYGPVNMQFLNDSRNADSFLWDFGDGGSSTGRDPAHTYHRKGSYSVKLTASRGNACVVSVIKYSLVIIANNNYIFIPNTFTPNGDGINDLFNVTITNINNYHIQLFTRWGQPLFESRNILTSWDGTYNGKPLPFGVYYYVIDAVGTDGEAIKKSGYITLIR